MDEIKGSVSKCPSCGAQLGAFVSTCGSCGYEITGIQASQSITALVNSFKDIERAVDEKGLTGSRREREIIQRKAQAIRDYPVASSREDLQQLLYFIQPKLVASVKPDPNIEDWRAKFVEVINRAKNAYKGDSAALAEFEAIAKSIDTSVADDLKIKAKRNPLFVALLGGLVVLGIAGFVMNQADKAKAAQCDATYAQGSTTESARLQAIEAVANQEFSNQKYQEALVSAGKLMWSYEEPCKIDSATKPKAVWDEKRAQLTASIQSGIDAQVAAKKAEADLVTAQAQAEQQKVLDEAKVEQQKAQAKAIAVKKAADDKKW